jgi:hypothetical protein
MSNGPFTEQAIAAPGLGYLPPMHSARATAVDPGIAKGSWSEIFRNGLGLYSALVIGGIAMNATQMLVIAIIMPTIVRDMPTCPPLRNRKFADSLLEGDGFEPSVPVRRTTLFEPPLSQHARTTAAFENARRPVQQLLLAVVGPVRMNAELTRQLGDRPVPPTAATTTPSL